MARIQITDEEIAGLSPGERRALIERLARPASELLPPAETLQHIRHRRIVFMAAAAILLVPWTAWLGYSLPRRYVAHHWTLTWVGFDFGLATMFGLTAYFAIRRRQLVVLTSFVTGVLLICDAWFDVTTSDIHSAVWSIGEALLFELPIAIYMMVTSLHMIRLMLARIYAIDDGRHLWSATIPIGPAGTSPPGAR